MIADDDNFRHFAGDLEKVIDRYQQEVPTDDARLLRQCQQFRELIGAEREFRETLIRRAEGPSVYRAFIAKICDQNGNILTARPYFRERQEMCIGPISQALKHRHVKSLYQYHFNFHFVKFVMAAREWAPRGKLMVLSRKISAIRNELIELNMPLAISQARIFWQKAPMKTQDTRFTFMDFVQIAADGLMSAVDKFCLPPDLDTKPEAIRVWRAVAIGRMKGNFIEMFSETSVHFFPPDKRKIYRANKHLKDFNGQVDFDKLAVLVNEDLKEDRLRTSASELADLMGAAANVGTGVNGKDDDEGNNDTPIDRATAAPDWQPDVRFERNETVRVLKLGIAHLMPLEQKLVRMRGVSLDSI